MLASFQNETVPTQRNLRDALAGTRTTFILKCKKVLPSKGLIHEDLDPAATADIYKHCAPATSVLCDKKYFQGSFDFLPIVNKIASQPIPCKDLTIDPYQIYLARYYQADTCLLTLLVLDDEQYRQLSAVTHSLNMGMLTEVNDEEELERVITLRVKVVSINSHDLCDISIDLNRTRQLAARLGPDVTVISGSGIHTYAEMRELSHFVSGFLIGSVLMKQADLGAVVKRALLGENKVCGSMRPQDARVAQESGTIYGSPIFVSTLSRVVNDTQAKAVIAAAPLQYVGVFRSTSPDEVVARARALRLAVVRLHGDEDQVHIDAPRSALADNVCIWEVLSVGETLPARTLRHIGKYPFDNDQGGSGQCFNWNLLQDQGLCSIILVGGLDAGNYVEAAESDCARLDFNSGVKSQSGIKDASKPASVFQTLRAY